MSKIIKGVVMVLSILYILSPIDLLPGPFDDTLVLLLNVATQKFLRSPI